MGGGNDKKQDRNVQTQAWANLNDIFGLTKTAAGKFGEAGTATLGAGKDMLSKAGDFFKTLLTGNRQKLAEATAPERTAALSAADATKRMESATGTSRGGGTAAANRESADKVRAQIDTLIGKVRPAAATGLESVGVATAGIGEAEIASMLQALGIGVSSTGTAGSQATSDIQSIRQAQSALWSALIGGAADVASAGIAKGG